MNDNDTPRIYVASLSDYNAGRLHGKWIEVHDTTADDIMEEVQAMLDESPEPFAEEWAIHDYEGFEGLRLSEYESFEVVAALGRMIFEHGEVFAAYADRVGDLEEALTNFEEDYIGTYDSLGDYAYELWGHEIERALDFGHGHDLSPYFDYDKLASDWDLGGDILAVPTSDHMVVVFRN